MEPFDTATVSVDPTYEPPGPEKVLGVIRELAARWHRHEQDQGLFMDGLKAGWVQAIAELLDTRVAVVNQLLRDGEL